MLTILIETDGQPTRTVRVERFPCRIGRASDAEVVLNGWRVGKVHAELTRIERGVRLVDLGTLTGTWVNGERIVEHAPLLDIDEVRIAGHRLRVIGGLEAGHVPMTTEPGRRPGADPDRDRPGLDASAQTGAPDRPGAPSQRGAPARHSELAQRSELSPRGNPPGRLADTGPAPREAPGWARRPSPSSVSGRSLEWRRLLHRRLLETIDLRRKDVRQLSAEQLRTETRVLLAELIAAEPELPPDLPIGQLTEEVLDEAIGLGPLEKLLADPTVSEVMVNSPTDIYVERHGRLARTDLAFSGEPAVRSVIDRIVAPIGRRIDESAPMVDARLPDGSRVNAIVPPLAVRGAAITIRRFNRQVLAPSDLVALGSASEAMVDFLRLCVTHRRNLLISGGTGSGKTTLLNVLSNLIPEEERIVTIEDAAELRLDHDHLVALEARPSNAEGRGAVAIRDLVRNALRMRPDRIVVGECRGGEALDMLQAMNTGHEGSLTTVHANTPRDAIARLETMVLMSGMDLPIVAIRDQIASAVHLIVQQARAADGRRRIVEITEVTGLEGSRVLMQPIFRWEQGGFRATGAVPVFVERLQRTGVELDWSCGEAA
ncbi:MAG: hypothetical protein RIS35_863 [Pseudomonadota bacterium]